MSTRFQTVLAALSLASLLVGGPAFARAPQGDSEIQQAIIQQSVADYKATGHPCACPYNSARNGSSCGNRSAYSRPGGAAPLCYPKDVTPGMIVDWKQSHH